MLAGRSKSNWCGMGTFTVASGRGDMDLEFEKTLSPCQPLNQRMYCNALSISETNGVQMGPNVISQHRRPPALALASAGSFFGPLI